MIYDVRPFDKLRASCAIFDVIAYQKNLNLRLIFENFVA
jgi:hypothetical protein